MYIIQSVPHREQRRAAITKTDQDIMYREIMVVYLNNHRDKLNDSVSIFSC